MLVLNTVLLASKLDDLINNNGKAPQLHVPKPIQFKESLSNDFRGDFQSKLNNIKVDVKIKFPNMKLPNVNIDSASWVVDATCTATSVKIELDQYAPGQWPDKAFIFIGQRWCLDSLENSGPWFVASNIQQSASVVTMDIAASRPEDYADYFEVTARLVKKEQVRKRNFEKDFEWVQLPFCYDEAAHGTCQKDVSLHRDGDVNIVCEDCWAYLNFGFLYKATGRLRKFYRGVSSTINMAAKGEMNFDIKIESRSTIQKGWEKFFDATKLISKIIPIIDIPDVLQLHPEASLWAGAHIKVVRNMDVRFGVEGDVDFELTSSAKDGQMKRFNFNVVPHQSTVEILENKGQADVTLTADVSLVFSLLNGILTDRAGTYLDSTAGIHLDGLTENCPNQYEYSLLKGYEMGLHIHGNRKSLLKQPLEPIKCAKCTGCATVGAIVKPQ